MTSSQNVRGVIEQTLGADYCKIICLEFHIIFKGKVSETSKLAMACWMWEQRLQIIFSLQVAFVKDQLRR